MKKQILLSIFIALLSYSGSGQETESTDSKAEVPANIWRIGIHASPTTGTGFSFKLAHNEKHEFQIVTLPLYYQGDGLSVHTAFNYYYKILDYRIVDFLVYGGGSYGYDQLSMNPSSILFDGFLEGGFPVGYDLDEEMHMINFTGGVGIQLGRTPSKKMGIQVGYGLYNVTNNFKTLLSLGATFELGLL